MRFVPFFMACVFLIGPAAADDLRDQVRELTRQLADNELAERDAAEKQLMELGTDVLKHLPEPNEQMPAEMRQRVIRIRQLLEVRLAKAVTAGSRVTLRAQDDPLSEVLADIEQQTGNKIVDFREFRRQPKTNPGITIELEDVLFWEALDQILDQAGMTTYPYAVNDEGEPLDGVAFVATDAPEISRAGRASYETAFRFEPLNVVARQNLRDASASALEVQVEMTWEPRLTPITLSLLRETIQATDANGAQLTRVGNGRSEVDVNEAAPQFITRFHLPDRDVTAIKTLSGQLEGLIPGSVETFRFEKLTTVKNQRQKKAGATVVLDSVRKNGQAWEVRILVRFESSAGALESHVIDWVLRNEAYLENAAGEKTAWATIEKTREVDDEFGMAYLFVPDDDIEKYTFVYKSPAALLKRQIPFELSDLPLP